MQGRVSCLLVFWSTALTSLAAIAFVSHYPLRKRWSEGGFDSFSLRALRRTTSSVGADINQSRKVPEIHTEAITRTFLDLTGGWPDWIHRDPPNPDKIKYPEILVSPSLPCESLSDPVLVPAVLTIAGRKRDRELMRHVYQRLTEGKVRPVFPVGRSVGVRLDEDDDEGSNPDIRLLEEAAQYGDLLIADFPEAYKTLPYKTLSIMSWFKTQRACDRVPFVMKIDSDVVPNWPVLVKNLKDFWENGYHYENGTVVDPKTTYLWMGRRWDNMPVIHDPNHRNYEPDLSDMEMFPPYTSGPAQIFNHQMADIVIRHRPDIHIRFRNEDAMIGLIVQGHADPTNRLEFVVFADSGYRKAACHIHTTSITDCQCDDWWTYHSWDSEWKAAYDMVINRCIPGKT